MSDCIFLSVLRYTSLSKMMRAEMHLNPKAALNALVWCGAGLVIFLQHKEIPVLSIGFLIGYLSYRGRMQKAGRCLDGSGKCEMTPTASYLADDDDATEEEEVSGPPVFWPELRTLLSDKLSTKHLEDNLR